MLKTWRLLGNRWQTKHHLTCYQQVLCQSKQHKEVGLLPSKLKSWFKSVIHLVVGQICICYIMGMSAVLDFHTFDVAAHAQYMPSEHARQVAEVHAAVANAAGQVYYANMEAKY